MTATEETQAHCSSTPLQPVQMLNHLHGSSPDFLFSQHKRRLDAYHFTVLKDQQDGDGLDTLSQALQDVWVLQDSERKKK